jgi:hypothetical protein
MHTAHWSFLPVLTLVPAADPSMAWPVLPPERLQFHTFQTEQSRVRQGVRVPMPEELRPEDLGFRLVRDPFEERRATVRAPDAIEAIALRRSREERDHPVSPAERRREAVLPDPIDGKNLIDRTLGNASQRLPIPAHTQPPIRPERVTEFWRVSPTLMLPAPRGD